MALIINNVVDRRTIRDVQSRTLGELSLVLQNSFGPNGSNTCIKKEGALPRYSKDGHTIIGSIHYNGIIEQSIKDDIESITRHIVKTVGDGTTSAVILSDAIFNDINSLEMNYKPIEITTAMQNVVNRINDMIMASKEEMTNKDVYDIAMIATNGNSVISTMLYNIYASYGNSVFIDVSPSTGTETFIKVYDGMTLDNGYCDTCYVNNTAKNTADIDNPEIYFFEHPIDTKEMGVYLDAIISRNIISPVNTGSLDAIKPTVIVAPKISTDMSSIMDSLISHMTSMPANNRLPICVITGYHDTDKLADLAMLCGAKMIKKYIDRDVYNEDVANGKAPTPDTIHNWAGKCSNVIAHSAKTVFVNPQYMYNEDGSYSNVYNNLLRFLKSRIDEATHDGENINDIADLKRRLHSLESNMIEMFVGGITQSDRDSLRDLVEDAVLNIRSAAEYGVGLAGNLAAYTAVIKVARNMMNSEIDEPQINKLIVDAIKNAYEKLIGILFSSIITTPDDLPKIVNEALDGKVYNLRENQWRTNVKSSIMSDITILNTVSKIIGILATCNQFIVPSAAHNIYMTK